MTTKAKVLCQQRCPVCGDWISNKAVAHGPFGGVPCPGIPRGSRRYRLIITTPRWRAPTALERARFTALIAKARRIKDEVDGEA